MIWKERLIGWAIVIIAQIIILIISGFYIHSNYLNLTKEKSKIEKLPTKQIQLSGYDFTTNEIILTWNNSYYYSWEFGLVDISYETSWLLYNHENKSYEKVQINRKNIMKYCILNKYLEDKTIDIFIYDYFKNKEIQEFTIYLNNIINVNDYLKIPLNENKFDNKICGLYEIDKLIKWKDYSNLVKKLKWIEKQISQNYNNPAFSDKVIDLDFFNTEEFIYLINTYIIDNNWLYKDNVEKVANILNIPKNLINAAILTEQVRWFFTNRWIIKDIIKTNKLIMVMSQFSYWIWWIKENAAIKTENYFSENHQWIYNEYLSWITNSNIRIEKLTNDYFIQILYVWWLVKSILDKREKGWYNISSNIWVIITLYNYWNPDNKTPHSNPKIWWAVINLDWKEYSFWALGTIFYYYLEFYY